MIREDKRKNLKKWLICEIDRFIDKVNSIMSKMVSQSRYQCPICGKKSSEVSEINADLYDHMYNKKYGNNR